MLKRIAGGLGWSDGTNAVEDWANTEWWEVIVARMCPTEWWRLEALKEQMSNCTTNPGASVSAVWRKWLHKEETGRFCRRIICLQNVDIRLRIIQKKLFNTNIILLSWSGLESRLWKPKRGGVVEESTRPTLSASRRQYIWDGPGWSRILARIKNL